MEASTQTGYDISEIMRILPQRYPFLFIDKVLSVHSPIGVKNRVGRKVVCQKNVSYNEHYFSGHFPHRPVMPGVLQIEIVAQAGALAAYRAEDGPQDIAIAAVRNARCRRPIVPGDTLTITAEITRDGGSILNLKGVIKVDGVVAGEAEIIAKVVRLPVDKA